MQRYNLWVAGGKRLLRLYGYDFDVHVDEYKHNLSKQARIEHCEQYQLWYFGRQ